MSTKINIDKAIGMVATTRLSVDDRVMASMIETLMILKELGFKQISKGDNDERCNKS